MYQIKKIVILNIFLILTIGVISQESESYKEVDSETYSLYLQSNWKELIKLGKTSLKQDITFYYLQVRMGIAYYELKKYRKAIPYFEKSRKLNRKNELVNEYLYYSYLFSGRSNDARKLTKELSSELKTKIGIKINPIFSSISFDLRAEEFEEYKAEPATGDLLQQDVRTDYSYFSFGAEHLIKNNRKISWSYSRINIGATIFDIGDLNEQVDNDRKIDQNQFYYSYQNQLKYGLSMTLAANLINIGSTGSELIPVWGRGGGGMISTTTRYATNELIGYFALRKDFSNFKIGLNSSISNLDKNFQIQPGIDFIYYPFANTNIYLSTKANYLMENANNQWRNEPIIKQAVGFRLFSFYFEPSITYGSIINFIENDAFIVNNDNDIISDRYEFLVYGSFFKSRLNLFAKYQNYNKTNTYLLNSIEHQNIYNNQTITGGIKWNF